MTVTSTYELIRQQLRIQGLGDDQWAVGELKDELPCLVLRDGTWQGGFFERGAFDVHFSEPDIDEAVKLFADWVRRGIESTRQSVESTAKWLAMRGEHRP